VMAMRRLKSWSGADNGGFFAFSQFVTR
jgi:hypothetical protein